MGASAPDAQRDTPEGSSLLHALFPVSLGPAPPPHATAPPQAPASQSAALPPAPGHPVTGYPPAPYPYGAPPAPPPYGHPSTRHHQATPLQAPAAAPPGSGAASGAAIYVPLMKGLFSRAPFPGLRVQPPRVAPTPDQVVIGYETTDAEVGCCVCDTLSPLGWGLASIWTVVLFPVAFTTCLFPGFHDLVQRPVFGTPPPPGNASHVQASPPAQVYISKA